jgi:hypothetical protein
MNPDVIAKAFVEGTPYYDPPFVVFHYDDFNDWKCSVVGSELRVDISDRIVGLVLLEMCTRVEGDSKRYYVLIKPHPADAKTVTVYNAIFKRLENVIGISMRAEYVPRGDYGVVLIHISGKKYPFIGVYSNRPATLVKRGNVLVKGYARRFAPYSMSNEYAEIYDRLKKLHAKLGDMRDELVNSLYHLTEYEFESIGLSDIYVRHLIDEIDSVRSLDPILDDVGIYIGKYTPRSLLSLYERTAKKAEEALTAIKTKIATDMLLS